MSPNIRSTITSQVIWFNKHIKIDNKSLCNNSLGKKKEELRRSNRIPDALSVYDYHLLKKNKYILQISATAKNYTGYKYL